MMQGEHEGFIRESIALSAAAAEKGNEPFGAVLVKDGAVILRAENTVSSGDPTEHAEMNLVRLALKQYRPEFLADCILYTSTEPCCMCAGAIYWSGIGHVVYACSEKRLGEIAGGGLDVPCRDIYAKGSRRVEVTGPVLEDEAAKVHLGYWTQ